MRRKRMNETTETEDTQTDRLQGSCAKIEFHLVFALPSPLRTLQPSSPTLP
jgi:hypothetical protein